MQCRENSSWKPLYPHLSVCLKLTCIQLPPVNLAEEGVRPELVTRPVLEAEPLVNLFAQQTLADGPGALTELLWVSYWVVQNTLLDHLVLHLETEQRTVEINSAICSPTPTHGHHLKHEYTNTFTWYE